MSTLSRPAKLKLTKAERADQLEWLRPHLTPHQQVMFIRIDPVNHPTDWIIVHEHHGEIDNISALVAAITDRQCGDRRMLRGWAYDSPGSILRELVAALGIPLTLGTI